jgi:gas vesicle protein
MNLENYGRQLLDVLADRSLEILRSTQIDDVRRVVRGELPASLTERAPSTDMSTLGMVGAALGIFAAGAAVGAGVAVLTTPSTGPELRQQIEKVTRDANKKVRKEAKQLRKEVEQRVDGAKSSVMEGMEQVTTAVGLTSPPTKSTAQRKAMNGHTGPRRTKKAPSRRAAHA